MRAWLRVVAAALVLAGCQSTLGPDTPRKYRCNRDLNGPLSTECPGGWRCGLEGTCHDPDEAFAFQCVDQADCASTWHCGVAGLCYDRATVQGVECRAQVPDDCAAGWRCGLNGRCHDQDAGVAYACASDSDCERGWRCDVVAQVCVDSTTEALRAAGPVTSRRVSPAFFGRPDFFTATRLYYEDFVDGGYCSETSHASALTDGGLTALFQSNCSSNFERDLMERFDLALPTTSPRALASVDRADYVLDSNGLLVHSFTDGGGTTRVGLSAFGADQLVVIDRESDDYQVPILGPLVFVTGASGYAVYDHDLGALLGPVRLPAADGGAQAVRDFAVAHTGSDSRQQWLVAAADEGVFVAERTAAFVDAFDGGQGFSWVPLSVPGLANARCDGPPPLRPVRVKTAASDYQVVLLEPAPGQASGALVRFTLDPNAPLMACDAGPVLLTAGPCRACPQGEVLVDYFANSDDYNPATVRCAQSLEDGGHFEHMLDWYAHSDDGGCALVPDDSYQVESIWPGALAVTASRSVSHGQAWLDEQGRAFVPSWEMTQAPRVVVGGGGGPLLTVTPALPYHGPMHVWELREAGFSWRSIRIPFTNYKEVAPEFLQLCSSVQGAPELVVRTSLDIDPSTFEPANPNASPQFQVTWLDDIASEDPLVVYRTVAQLQNTQGLPAKICWPDAPSGVLASLAVTSSGQRQLLVSAQDSLWAGLLPDAGALADGGTSVALLQPRLTPVPRGQITAIATTTPVAGSRESVSGYLIAQLRVFRFFAFDASQWGLHEVTLPEGAPTGLWADGASARVAFDDGRVFSLPSRTQLAPPVPNGALQFTEVCGQGYAMTPDGVYRLQASALASGGGTWVPLELGISSPAASTGAFVGGRLYSVKNELFVFNRFGTTVKVVDGSCQ